MREYSSAVRRTILPWPLGGKAASSRRSIGWMCCASSSSLSVYSQSRRFRPHALPAPEIGSAVMRGQLAVNVVEAKQRDQIAQPPRGPDAGCVVAHVAEEDGVVVTGREERFRDIAEFVLGKVQPLCRGALGLRML